MAGETLSMGGNPAAVAIEDSLNVGRDILFYRTGGNMRCGQVQRTFFNDNNSANPSVDIRGTGGSVNIDSMVIEDNHFTGNGPYAIQADATVNRIKHTGNFYAGGYSNNISNEPFGTVALSGGTATVSTKLVGSASHIQLTPQSKSATLGIPAINGITPGVTFTIGSSNSLDANTIAWHILDTS